MALCPALAAEQYPRLAGDLGEHRRADMAFGAGACHEGAELLDLALVLYDPVLDTGIDRVTAAAAQEVDSKLLEVARQAGRQ